MTNSHHGCAEIARINQQNNTFERSLAPSTLSVWDESQLNHTYFDQLSFICVQRERECVRKRKRAFEEGSWCFARLSIAIDGSLGCSLTLSIARKKEPCENNGACFDRCPMMEWQPNFLRCAISFLFFNRMGFFDFKSKQMSFHFPKWNELKRPEQTKIKNRHNVDANAEKM